MKRLTTPMRKFLQALVDGQQPRGPAGAYSENVGVMAVANALRKRGLVTQSQKDYSYSITPQGRTALESAPHVVDLASIPQTFWKNKT